MTKMRFLMSLVAAFSVHAGRTNSTLLVTQVSGIHALVWFFLLCLTMPKARAQSNPPPVLNIGWFSNQLQVSIRNAAAGRVYQLQGRSSLDKSTNWMQAFLGTPGQTNFTVPPQSNSNQFFRACLLSDVPPQILSFTASPATL